MNCVVFVLSENLHNKLIKFYDQFKCDKFPPYSKFQAKNFDVTITLYESGKVMFQGIGADIEASIWIDAERRLNGKIIDPSSKKKDAKKKDDKTSIKMFTTSTIGSDEVGCGDLFGPIVVASTYVSEKDISFLNDLGVKDSKKLTDDKIKLIAPEIIKKIPYSCMILNNETYNANYKDINMVKLKCIMHNKVLINLIEKYNPKYEHAVVDEFVNSKKYYEYLSDVPKVVKNIYFHTNGESVSMAVAAASIICRYIFLGEMDKLSELCKMEIPKGAGENADKALQKLMETKDESFLKTVAKLNFKNYTKLK